MENSETEKNILTKLPEVEKFDLESGHELVPEKLCSAES